MIIKRIFFTLFIAMLVSTAKAQSDDNDTLKKFISWTIAMDGHLGDPKQIEGILSYVDTGYNSLKYEMSDTIYFYPGLYIREPDWAYPSFATAFKITTRWGVYYLMKVDYCPDPVIKNFRLNPIWLRVSGFKECDLKVFFDVLLAKYYLTKKRLKTFFESIEEPLLKELDWDCIFRGYFKGDRECPAYISNTYSLRQLECFEPSGMGFYSKKIYSTFSIYPWSGIVR
jgi:hypothetical protein